MVPASQAAVDRAVDFVPSPLMRTRRCRLRRGLSDEERASCRSLFFGRVPALTWNPTEIYHGWVRRGDAGADPVYQKYAVPATRAGGTAGRGNAGDATTDGAVRRYPAVM